MRCPSCQIELPDDARFCGGCGKRFESTPPREPLRSTEAARPTPAPTPSRTPPASQFALTPDDFARAFARACAAAGKEPGDGPAPVDHVTLRERATALGIPILDMERALHRVGVEKLPEEKRRAMGVVLDDEAAPPTRPLLVPIIIGLNAIAIVVGLLAFVWRDDAPATVTIPPQAGEIDVPALTAAVDELTREAEGCYQKLLQKKPGVSGEVVLAIRIGLDGRAAEASVRASALDDDTAHGCIRERALARTWPSARVAPVDVDIPLVFSVTEKTSEAPATK